jgi:hypothetical protein
MRPLLEEIRLPALEGGQIMPDFHHDFFANRTDPGSRATTWISARCGFGGAGFSGAFLLVRVVWAL